MDHSKIQKVRGDVNRVVKSDASARSCRQVYVDHSVIKRVKKANELNNILDMAKGLMGNTSKSGGREPDGFACGVFVPFTEKILKFMVDTKSRRKIWEGFDVHLQMMNINFGRGARAAVSNDGKKVQYNWGDGKGNECISTVTFENVTNNNLLVKSQHQWRGRLKALKQTQEYRGAYDWPISWIPMRNGILRETSKEKLIKECQKFLKLDKQYQMRNVAFVRFVPK